MHKQDTFDANQRRLEAEVNNKFIHEALLQQAENEKNFILLQKKRILAEEAKKDEDSDFIPI